MKTKLILFLALLALCGSEVRAQVYTISSGNGTFYASSTVSNTWANKFVSSNQKLTITFAQGFGVANTELYAPTDASEGTYTISVNGLAQIASYSISGTTSGDLTFTPNGGVAQTITNGNTANWSADVNASSTSFKLQGGHITGVTFTVTVVPVPDGVYQIDLHANNVSYSRYLMANAVLSGQINDGSSAPSNGHFVFKRVAGANNDYTIQEITTGKYVYAKEVDNLNSGVYYRGNSSNPLGVESSLPSQESADYNKYIWTIQSKVPTSGSQKNGGEYNIISKANNTLCLALWAGGDSYYSLYNDFNYDGSKARLTSATLSNLLGSYTVAELRNAYSLDEIKTASSYSSYELTSAQQTEYLDNVGFPTTVAYTQFLADFTDSGAKTPQAAINALLASTMPSSGFYYIKNKGQSTYMFRDENFDTYGENMTLLNTELKTSKYIWKVDVDGTTVNVHSLTGKSITHSRSATTDTDMSMTSAWQTGLSSAFGAFYMGYLQDPNQDGAYTAKGNGNYDSATNPRVVTYYSSYGGDINNAKAYWVFEDVDESDYDVYTVTFINAPGDNYVTYSGSETTGNLKVYDGGYYLMTKDASVSASDFKGESVTNCSSTITIEGKAITVTYTNWKTTIDAYIAANDVWTNLSNAGKVGYPANIPANTGDLNSAKLIIDGGTYSELVYNGLVTAYNAYKNADVLLPEVGKIYTIQSYVKSNSRIAYLENIDGKLAITTDASATAKNNLWVVRTGNKLQSAADFTKYLTYESAGLNSGVVWTFSKGTELPYISMYNSSISSNGRYVASNANGEFGSAGTDATNYWAGSIGQYTGWSTDFKFVESNEYALYSIVFSNIPSGTPTVTYEETEYSNGTDLIAPISLTTASLTVTEIDGYTSDVSIIGNTITVRYFYNISESRTFADTWNYNSEAWTALASDEVPASIADDHDPQYTYYYKQTPIRITTGSNRTITTRFKYSSGDYRMDIAGVDLINASTGKVAYSDYHEGYSGSKHVKQAYALPTVAPGYYYIRYISYGQGNSSEKLTKSQGDIYVCVSPEVGFYRIKGYSNNYITSNTVGSNASMNGTASANNIIYYSKDRNIIFYGTGYGLYNTHTVAPIGSTLNAYYFSTGYNGNYCITSNLDDTNGTYCYDNTSNGMKLDRNTNPITSDNYQTDWTLEEVTSLPVTLSNIDGHGFASFYTPVGISSLPDGVKAYIASVDGDRIRFTNITDIPANTGVILYQPTYTEGAVNLTIGNASSSTTGNVLNGIVASTPLATVKTNLSATNILTMQNDDNKGLGFYQYNGTNLNGFRVFVDSNDAVGVKSFVFDFDDEDATEIVSLLEKTEEGTAIYNIAGQRLSKMQKGINIVNGKKILK